MTAPDHGSSSRLTSALSDIEQISSFLAGNSARVDQIADRVTAAIKTGNTIYFIGNGGAAAEAQHIAAEFVGRMRRERQALPALALTTDASILTAVSNDWDFDQIFERQIEAHCSAGDIVVGLSGSGNSTNLVKGLNAAKSQGATTIACTGDSPNSMSDIADIAISLPTESTPRAQEMHLLLWHVICEMVDDALLGNDS